MARPETIPAMPRLVTLAAVAVVIVALYLGKDVLMPLALGVLFCFLLAPLVTRLERAHLSRIPAVIVVTLFSFVVLGAVTYFVMNQLMDLTTSLPAYRENIHARVMALRGHNGPISAAARSIQELSREIIPTQPATSPATTAHEPTEQPLQSHNPSPETPVPVKVVSTEQSSFGTVITTLSYALKPLGTAAIVVVFVVFMLIQREDLRDRLIYLLGHGHIHLTTQALDDAGHRISHYLLMQLIINLCYGVPVAAALYLLGLPNPLAFGLLATLLRYLPYVGPWLAATMPILLALAMFPDWWHPLAVLALFIVLELLINNVLEPLLYGNSTGLSPVAIIVAAVFWTWLWGPVGLLLATPLTVCLVVAGKYVGHLEFLNVLLSDEPVWDPANRYYQRLLAMDDDEAGDLLEAHLNEKSLIEVYDQVVLPALHLAERDRHQGHLTPEREEFIRSSIQRAIEELDTPDAPLEPETSSSGSSCERPVHPPDILCLPAHDEADELAAQMFAQVLRKSGFPAHVGSAESLASESLDQVEQAGAHVVCISAMPPAAGTHARYLCKRLRGRFEQVKLVVGLWNVNGDLARARERLSTQGCDKVTRSFQEALNAIRCFNIPAKQPS